MTEVVVPFARKLYEAKPFSVSCIYGQFKARGTLCGNIDFVGPFRGCYTLSPDEAQALIVMLQAARADVLENSEPYHDPRILA